MTEHHSESAYAPSFLDEARRYREQGGYRAELVDYLHRCGIEPGQAEHLADRFDLELGLAGHPRPHDVNPAVARQLDAHWELMASTAEVPAPEPVVEKPPVRSALDLANEASHRHATGMADLGRPATLDEALGGPVPPTVEALLAMGSNSRVEAEVSAEAAASTSEPVHAMQLATGEPVMAEAVSEASVEAYAPAESQVAPTAEVAPPGQLVQPAQPAQPVQPTQAMAGPVADVAMAAGAAAPVAPAPATAVAEAAPVAPSAPAPIADAGALAAPPAHAPVPTAPATPIAPAAPAAPEAPSTEAQSPELPAPETPADAPPIADAAALAAPSLPDATLPETPVAPNAAAPPIADAAALAAPSLPDATLPETPVAPNAAAPPIADAAALAAPSLPAPMPQAPAAPLADAASLAAPPAPAPMPEAPIAPATPVAPAAAAAPTAPTAPAAPVAAAVPTAPAAPAMPTAPATPAAPAAPRMPASLPTTLDAPEHHRAAGNSLSLADAMANSAPAEPQPEPEPAPMASKANVAKPPRPADEDHTSEWQETTEFGYAIAQSWDEDDPNEAINEAATLARQGKTQEQIIDYLLSCHVSEDEAKYVAQMTGARSVPKPKLNEDGTPVAKQRRKKSGRMKAIIALTFVAGGLMMYLGWSAWNEGVESTRSPLSLAAVGAALIICGLWVAVRRR